MLSIQTTYFVVKNEYLKILLFEKQRVISLEKFSFKKLYV
jgi:hypothetical protein